MEDKHPQQYLDFFQKFNEHEFYECHDLLEEIWMEQKQNKFLQGLLQMAVGLYHLEYGNIKGARWMFQNAQKYLKAYAPFYWDLDVEDVLNYLECCLQVLPEEDRIPYDNVKKLSVPYRSFTLRVPEADDEKF
ncbi:DUF309 domain-containing protein [Brevibacillus daliensis]|uniref:DUF309 domain-containing protein n=1 Tax=Brevibacillus daliensis TaxID=2892995 RepID=UPI001E4782C8|nr:DUF309 domain-containing protein [Brevibacillus daliensis]